MENIRRIELQGGVAKTNRVKDINNELKALLEEFYELTGHKITNINPLWHTTLGGSSKVIKVNTDSSVS